jgi:hypothetical protein
MHAQITTSNLESIPRRLSSLCGTDRTKVA